MGHIYAAPGRINLIGEHTDYNGGFVFPGAVEQSIMAVIRPNDASIVRAYSADLGEYAEWLLTDTEGPSLTCFRFVYGVMRELQERGITIGGFDTVFAGDIPLGAGMSSSAALESCFAFGLNDLFAEGEGIDRWQMALVGQATEHKYIGCNCGIMDQFASCFGKAGQLMRLDCRSGEYQYFPFHPKGYRLLLVNSCVKHELAGSPYNDRRRSCERVVEAIRLRHPERNIETLRDVTWADLDEVRNNCSAEDIRRATYVLGETDRVLAVCQALKTGDYDEVGRQMYLTHAGLSKDYEVSCEELDFLTDFARACGVTGSRIMGGGFGGCTINLVRNELYNTFKTKVSAAFFARYHVQPQLIDIHISEGAHIVRDC